MIKSILLSHNLLYRIVHSRLFNLFYTAVTIVTIIIVTINSELDYFDDYFFYRYIEYAIFILLTIEYIFRLLASTSRLKYAVSTFMMVDLLVLISFFFPLNLVHLRFIRILKLFNIFRSRKYRIAVDKMIKVCKQEKESLAITAVLFFMLVFVSASLMCLIESRVQDDFASIPRAMWWAMITATSVGYGDLVPITLAGKVLASFTAMLGIIIYSIMTAFLANGFAKEFKKKHDNKNQH
jgi:voltage-gated potassium channel